MRFSGGVPRAWHAALLYAALTAGLAYPLARHAAGHVLSVSADTDLFLWTLSWDVHALVHQPLSIFDANIFAPLHRTLAYSEHLIGSGAFAAPVLWLTGNPVLALNAVALLSCVLCGTGTYLLARQVGIGAPGAALSGLIFAFAPPRFLRIDQLFLATIQWIPFGLAYWHAYLNSGDRFNLRMTAAFFTLQALTSGHGTVFLAIAAAALAFYRWMLGEPIAIVKRVRDLGIAGALLLAPIVPIAIAYARVQAEMGLRRSLDDWVITTPESFLASPTYVHSFLLARLFPGAAVNEHANAYLFPGYLPLILAAAALLSLAPPAPGSRHVSNIWSGLIGIVSRWRAAPSRADTVFYALLVLCCVWLAIGPPFGLWPCVYWLPGFNFIRAASRFMLLATLGLSVMAGAGFEWAAPRLTAPARLAAAAIVAALLVAEFAVPMDVVPYRPVIPAADRWLVRQPAPFTIAEAPLPDFTLAGAFQKRQAEFMLHSTAHWQKTVHGWSGLLPPGHFELFAWMTGFPDEDSLRLLAAFHVDYVVVHTDLYPPGAWAEVERRLAAYQGRLELRYRDDTSRVYALKTLRAQFDKPLPVRISSIDIASIDRR
jgi:hypothetical protein